MLVQYVSRFSQSKTALGHCKTLLFRIDIPERTPPIAQRPYRTNPALSKQVVAILYSYLAAGLIRHLDSPWTSPLEVISKKDDSIRITVNYKRFNAKRIVGKWSLSCVDEALDSLRGSSVLSTFDLVSGFF